MFKTNKTMFKVTMFNNDKNGCYDVTIDDNLQEFNNLKEAVEYAKNDYNHLCNHDKEITGYEVWDCDNVDCYFIIDKNNLDYEVSF